MNELAPKPQQQPTAARWRWPRIRRRLSRVADVASFAALGFWALLVLSGVDAWGWRAGSPTGVGVTASGAALALVLAARRFLDPVTPLREVPLIGRLSAILERPAFSSQRIAPIGVVLFVASMGAVALSRHWTFRSNTFDLGLFENVLWNTVHGRIAWSDVLGRRFFGEHLSPILLLLAVPYGFVQRAETLLIVQTVALGLGALPLSRLARRELGEGALANAVVISYLAYLPLRGAARFDFHPVALATPLLLEAFVAFREGRWRRGVWAWGLALVCDEGVAPVAAMLGLYVALFGGNRRLGATLFAVAIGWLLAATQWIVPWFRGGPYPFFMRLGSLQQGRIPNLLSLDRVNLLVLTLGPVAFLPLVSPIHALLALPSLAINLLSDARTMHSVSFHYTSTVTPMLFVATVMGAKNLLAREDLRVVLAFYPTPVELRRYLAALLVLGAVVFAGWSPIAEVRMGWEASRADRFKILSQLPEGEPVSAQGHIGAHLARRRGLSLFPEHLATWVVVESDADPWPLRGPDELRSWLEHLRSKDGCSLAAREGQVSLFHCDAGAIERLTGWSPKPG